MVSDAEDPHDDWDELIGWHECDRRCPDCGSPAEEGNWWDDHPDNGGACIGSIWRCTRECGWADWA